MGVTVDARCNDDLQVFGEVNYDLYAVKYGLVSEYNAGNDTRIKAKITETNSVMLSLIHNYNNLVNFSINNQMSLIRPSEKDKDTKKSYLKYNFGVQVEFASL